MVVAVVVVIYLSGTDDLALLFGLLGSVLAFVDFGRWCKEPRTKEVLPEQVERIGWIDEQQEPEVVGNEREDVDDGRVEHDIFEIVGHVALHVQIAASAYHGHVVLGEYRLSHVFHEIERGPREQRGEREEDDKLGREAFPKEQVPQSQVGDVGRGQHVEIELDRIGIVLQDLFLTAGALLTFT